MKHLKKILSFMTALALAVMPLCGSVLTVAADEPATYYISNRNNEGELRYVKGSEWDDTVGAARELYYMNLDLKDGDILIIDTVDEVEVKVSASPSNVTFLQSSSCVFYAPSIQNCYVLDKAYVAVNANVTNATVTLAGTANFNQDVSNLYVYAPEELKANIFVEGVCDHLKGYTDNNTVYEFYSFAKGILHVEDGAMVPLTAELSSTPPETPAAATTPAAETTPATAPAATPTAPSVSSDEYDDVPKTGESSAYLLAFGLAALCFTGSYALRKRA